MDSSVGKTMAFIDMGGGDMYWGAGCIDEAIAASARRGLTLVHFPASSEHFLCGLLGGFSGQSGLGSGEKWTSGQGLAPVHFSA